MSKRIISVLLILVLILAGCGKSDPKKEVREKLEKEYGLSSPMKKVLNDVTGKWRLATCVTSANVTEYAQDYYDAYFESDDEVHFIINFGTHTTNKLIVQAGMMFIEVYEHVDKEETDAKKLCSGILLQEHEIQLTSKDK